MKGARLLSIAFGMIFVSNERARRNFKGTLPRRVKMEAR